MLGGHRRHGRADGLTRELSAVVAPPFVGLTGGIAAGKSEALAALERLGAATLSTDAVVHALYDDPEVRTRVVERWGVEVAPNGVVDRSAIAERIFGDPAERTWLEAQLWPRVRERVARWRASAGSVVPAPVALVVEVPLLFEGGMASGFDSTVAVVAPDALRRERAGARGHARLEERTARQLSQAQKAAHADHVVVNHGTVEALERELSALLAKLTA